MFTPSFMWWFALGWQGERLQAIPPQVVRGRHLPLQLLRECSTPIHHFGVENPLAEGRTGIAIEESRGEAAPAELPRT